MPAEYVEIITTQKSIQEVSQMIQKAKIIVEIQRHPQNILVVDENNIEIPANFVTSTYVDIDETILSKYKIKHWVKPIFGL